MTQCLGPPFLGVSRHWELSSAPRWVVPKSVPHVEQNHGLGMQFILLALPVTHLASLIAPRALSYPNKSSLV